MALEARGQDQVWEGQSPRRAEREACPRHLSWSLVVGGVLVLQKGHLNPCLHLHTGSARDYA